MKKYFLYGLGAVMGLALTACDGYKEPNPPAQSNPQTSILQAKDVTAESAVSSTTYDLTKMMADNENIQLAKISCSALPEGYTMGALTYVSADNFATSFPLACEVNKAGEEDIWNVEIVPDSLQAVYNDNISLNVDPIKLSVRFLATTVLDSQVAIVGGADNFFGPYTLNVVPAEPAELEMDGPFLYTPGGSNGWNQDASQKLFTMDGGKTFIGFAVLLDEFKFTDQSNWDGTNYGAGEEEGVLSTDGSAGNIKPETNGLYWCRVNVEDLTYELTLISSIGAIGDFNGWAESVNLTSDDYLIWTGNVNFGEGGGFKFRCNDDWGVNLGGDTFKYLVPDGPNLNAPAGTATVTLNLGKLPYSCKVESK